MGEHFPFEQYKILLRVASFLKKNPSNNQALVHKNIHNS
jgi:hypothetical protein